MITFMLSLSHKVLQLYSFDSNAFYQYISNCKTQFINKKLKEH